MPVNACCRARARQDEKLQPRAAFHRKYAGWLPGQARGKPPHPPKTGTALPRD
jgi:hypothetical protein